MFDIIVFLDNNTLKREVKMIIRNFAKEDLFQVLELCREVRQHHIDILGGYFTEQDDNFEQMAFLDSLEDENTIALVAEENEIICGYLLADIKTAPYLIAPHIAHIGNFGVKKEIRHQGIGKKLMNSFLEICQKRNIDEIRLGVYNKNIDSYKFYENYGFEPMEQKMVFKLPKE